MKVIGGFFELEKGVGSAGAFWRNAYELWCGRACLSVILKQNQAKSVWVPFYCCDSLLEPLHDNAVEINFYPINESFEPSSLPVMGRHDFIIGVNYFGLKTDFMEKLSAHYQEKAIIDNTHAFFAHPLGQSWTFNSARKFFGVSDGAYLFAPQAIARTWSENAGVYDEHLVTRLKGDVSKGFSQFQFAESQFNSEPKAMSSQAKLILSQSIDYAEVAKKRCENFEYLRSNLSGLNQIVLKRSNGDIPYCFPFLPSKPMDRSSFYKSGIFFPKLWEDCLKRSNSIDFEWEKYVSENLMALPIDHRYGPEDLKEVVALVRSFIK